MAPPGLTIVHDGRSGYIEIEGRRYTIEHVEGGRFSIHFPSGNRARARARDLELLTRLCMDEPQRWQLERRDHPRRH